jgi:hypothetical protein
MRKFDGFFVAMSDDQHSQTLIFTVSLSIGESVPLPATWIWRISKKIPDNYKQLTDGKTGFV